MPRKLKSYQTSIGFFDLAIAAPSMKAALESWGADSNLFHQGFAREADDPKIISATTAHPGVVLCRPVGTDEAFKVTSALPKNLTRRKATAASRKKAPPPGAAKGDDARARKSAAAYKAQRRKAEAAQRKDETARDKKRARIAAEVAKAQKALDDAEQQHKTREAALQAERAEIEKRAEAEHRSWTCEREKRIAALDKAKKSDD